jgi:pimeloyl-ACP methyl ester carboxylesterase
MRQYPTHCEASGDPHDHVIDPVNPTAVNAEYLHERLPKSKLDILDAKHFISEDAADQYAALVTSWFAGGYAATGKSPG